MNSNEEMLKTIMFFNKTVFNISFELLYNEKYRSTHVYVDHYVVIK